MFLLITVFSHAQNNNIIISDSLTEKAEKYNFDRAKIKKFKFGEYRVIKAKGNWISSTSHATYKTYEENIDRNKFSFILINNSLDSAKVKALFTKISQYRKSGGFLLQALTGIESSNYEGLNNSSSFAATIVTTKDQKITWNLLMKETPDKDGKYHIQGSLSNGVQTIYIAQIGFGKVIVIKKRFVTQSPVRYEFIEHEQSLSALRIDWDFSTSLWFKPYLEPNLKLILAAAMTSITQTEFGFRFD